MLDRGRMTSENLYPTDTYMLLCLSVTYSSNLVLYEHVFTTHKYFYLIVTYSDVPLFRV
jgi:hypothetical protein